MNRRDLLLLLLLSGCARPTRKSPASKASWLELGVGFEQVSSAEAAWSAEELERIAGLVRRRATKPGGDRVQSIVHVVFQECGFVREVEDSSLRFVLLPSVLRLRRGNCVGLGMLLLALAELAGGAASGVLRPGHFHVRFSDAGRARNVEPLRSGEELPETWYDGRFPVVGQATYYARPLTQTEVRGIIEYNIGNERKREQRWSDARTAYEAATAHFPDFAEAHASLGSVLHVLGSLAAAEQAYRRAFIRNPALPGLEWNLELLRAEQRSAG